MNYFRFEIGTMPDGSRITYSPGWHGTMPHCPKDVTVLLYDDDEGYGIAQTNSPIVQPEIKEVSKAEALDIVDKADSTNAKVFKGLKLKYREWGKVSPKVVQNGN
jgi:glutaredoxin 2